jgi:HSP20 family protein
MDHLFDEFLAPHSWALNGGHSFPFDMYEEGDAFVVKATVPGLRPEDIDISVDDGVLTISGEMQHDEEEERENYLHRELHYGAFSRSLPLPASIDEGKAEATVKDGILTITLPKAERARAKTIKVKVGK